MMPSLASRFFDRLFPVRCLLCEQLIDQPKGGVCATCWRNLTWIGPPLCSRCGVPFEVDITWRDQCERCWLHPPVFARARAALVYQEPATNLVLSFKYADQTYAAPIYARWLERAGSELLHSPPAPYIVPVPLHRWRLLRRRYNQAALLAYHLARLTKLPFQPLLLDKHRQTASQQGLNFRTRQLNLKGSFRLRPRQKVQGQRVVLIDDVLTTGATVTECAKILYRAGASTVDVLTLARRLPLELQQPQRSKGAIH